MCDIYTGHVTDNVLTMAIPPFEHDPLQLAYVQVADHIAARIEDGEFKRGTRLPSERDLSTEYGVAYNTVRRSMDVLRERGLVITLRGHGNYAARKP